MNIKEVREYAYQKEGLDKTSYSALSEISNLRYILLKVAKEPDETLQKYITKNKWNEIDDMEKSLPRKAVISALLRKKSQPTDGGLLSRDTEQAPNQPDYTPKSDLNNWHPDDPTKGAIAWVGTGGIVGRNNNKWKTNDNFVSFYENFKENGILVYDTPDRIVFWRNQPTDKGDYGTIFKRHKPEYIEKVYIPKNSQGTTSDYKEARRRSQGSW